MKNCDRGLEGLRQHFQALGHISSLFGPTLSRQMTCLFFPAEIGLITIGFIYATLSLNRLARSVLTICKKIFATSK